MSWQSWEPEYMSDFDNCIFYNAIIPVLLRLSLFKGVGPRAIPREGERGSSEIG